MEEAEPWTLILPGRIDDRTGGTIYDARMVRGSREAGNEVDVVELVGGRYPQPSATDRELADGALGSLATNRQVIVDGLCLGALPNVAARHATRLRLVGLVHHPLCDETGLTEAVKRQLLAGEREALGFVRGVICTSEFTRERISELRLVREGTPVHVVEPGVAHAETGAPLRAGEPVQLLSVGSLTPRKALTDAAIALASLDRAICWHWTIAGRPDLDPRYAETLRAAVGEHGIEDRVTFAGQVSDALLEELYQASHVLLHPAHYEGYGMVITEAVARGLPVICSTGGALRWTLPEGCGMTFPPGDVGALFVALTEALTPSGTLGRLREGALDARQRLIPWKEAVRTWERARAALR